MRRSIAATVPSDTCALGPKSATTTSRASRRVIRQRPVSSERIRLEPDAHATGRPPSGNFAAVVWPHPEQHPC